MATLINNAGVQHYANKMVLAENRKVGSKSLPTALSDIDNLIDEMKTQFDAEYGSALDMELNNNENVFSVGSGIDVDKKNDVENSFTDVELSGNSMVNLCPVRTISHTKIDDVQLYSFKEFHCPLVKVNTTYTVFVNITKNPNSVSGMTLFTFVHNGGLASEEKCFTNQTGYQVFTLTTKNMEVPKGISFRFANSHGGDLGTYECTDLVILEGDWTNKPIPQYFKGMKSVGEKEDGNHKISISSRGKNLFNISDTPTKSVGTSFEKDKNSIVVTTTNDSTNYANVSFKIPLKPLLGKRISGKATIEVIQGNVNSAIVCSYEVTKGNYRYLTFNNTPASQTIPSNCYSDYLSIQLTNHNRAEVGVGKVKYSNIQIEINDLSTDYEPHKSDKKEILLNEPLRGIPNGIKDTIEKVNGEWKIVRKVGSIVLNGSEPWKEQVDGSTEEFLDIRCGYPTLLNRNRQNGLCDKFNYITKGSPIGEQEGIQLYTHTTQSQFIASMSKSRFSTVDSFKEYLAQNHTTVLYELATPIIEDISPVTLQCWKNGTISIDEVLPVETTHTVALNKPAQIKRNIEELTVLRKRVQALEDFYDQVALEQAYKLELINHSFELDYI